ncbi:MAG TPA: hypothetical protein VHG28_10335, partial [Longimicrobiaceae bacterium]|nr:hypothetical protein [Longimicrobiaceae bacterium]
MPDGVPPPQLADQAAPGWRERAGWAAGWLAVVALAVWTRRTTPGWLVLAAAGALLWTALAARGGRRWGLGAAGALWLATGIASGIQMRLHRITHDWEVERFRVEERAEQALGRELDALVDRGERAVDGVIAFTRAGMPERGPLFEQLAALQAESGVSALAIYGPDGVPVAWAGEHRGTVPD